jgi:hypothetical protein
MVSNKGTRPPKPNPITTEDFVFTVITKSEPTGNKAIIDNNVLAIWAE